MILAAGGVREQIKKKKKKSNGELYLPFANRNIGQI